MLKFLRNGFRIVIVQKIRKKGLSNSVKMHSLVTRQWAWYDDVMNGTIFARYEYCLNLVQLK